VVQRTIVVGRKKRKRFRSLESSLGVSQGRLHSKGGTAAKSSRLRDVVQGWPPESMFRLFRCAWVKIPNTLLLFPFFLDQLLSEPPALTIIRNARFYNSLWKDTVNCLEGALGLSLLKTYCSGGEACFQAERLAESNLAEQRSPGRQKRNL